jgi:hypothetical protein
MEPVLTAEHETGGASRTSYFRAFDSIVRPANTTQYTVGDVVGDNTARPFKFSKIARGDGVPFWVLNAVMVSNNVPTIAGQFNLHLYRNQFTPDADNAAFTPSLEESAELIGIIQFDTAYKLSTVTQYVASDLRFMFVQPDPILSDVFGVLTAANAYVPASAEVIRVYLGGVHE